MVSTSTWVTVGIIAAILFLLPLCFYSDLFSPQAQLDIQFNVAGVCGNGVIDGGEQCDLGPYNDVFNSGCDSSCDIVNIPEKDNCEASGGTWTLFNDDCADSCDSQKLYTVQDPTCANTQTFACDCDVNPPEETCADISGACAYLPQCPQWTPPAPNWCTDPGDIIVPGAIVNRCQMPPSCLSGEIVIDPPYDPCDAVPADIFP